MAVSIDPRSRHSRSLKPMLKQLVYVSSAVHPFSHDELVQILRVSHRNNVKVGVTGALLHAEGNIMHVMEGPPDAVDAVYSRVSKDPRHHGVLTLLEQYVEERTFANWSIGFLRPELLDDEDRAIARSLYDLTEPAPGAVRRLMASFRKLLPMHQRVPEEA